ncbi:hypothetical protein ACSBPU_05655 [Parapusillimonas sp. JC17]|uniref:hypothetical protein n=1 Tax=Parapusillimonas sp. JC17 TaxID=3445768 RepID=UPI003F9EC0F0
MLILQISLDPTRKFTDDSGDLRPLTELHTAAMHAMWRTAAVKTLTFESYAGGDRLLLSEALEALKLLARLAEPRQASTVVRETLGLLCMHGKVFTDGTTVWLLEARG